MYTNIYIFNIIDNREHRTYKFTIEKCKYNIFCETRKSEVEKFQIPQIGVRL